MYSSRNFMIFSVSELSKIDFTQVLETSAETVRKSADGTKTFVKWNYTSPELIEGDIDQPLLVEVVPPSVDSLTTKEGPYSYNEILEILSAPEWTAPMKNEMPDALPN